MAIAPSTYYAHRAQELVSQADWDDAHMANRLLDIWRANRSLMGPRSCGPPRSTAGFSSAGTKWPA